MKNLLITAALLCSTMSYAQNRGGAVMLMPDIGQGYLVMNKAEYPDVETWTIELNQRVFNSDSTYTDKALDKVTLKGNLNYWEVPEKYLAAGSVFFINVSGTDQSSSMLVQEGSILISDAPSNALQVGATPWLPGCKWVCNGSYYAWEIQSYVNPLISPLGNEYNVPSLGGPSFLAVEEAGNFNEALQEWTPFYRYITAQQYNDACNMGGFYLPGVPCVDETEIWMAGPISIPQGASSAYPDINGNPIPGPIDVYAVGKPLGNWGGGNTITTPDLMFGTNKCSNDTWWAMGMVNDNADFAMDGTGNDFYPPLTCNGNVTSGASGSSASSISCIQGVWDDFLNTPTPFPDENDSIGDVWTPLVEALTDCMTEDGEGDGSVLSWQAQLDKISIHSLNDPTAPVIAIDPNDAQTFSNGFTLQPGLYNFGFAIKGIGYVPMVLEVDKKLTVSMALADLLSVTIYPVPIVGDKFNIDMTASDDLKFTYEFRDDTGKLLHEEKFSLKKGQQWKHTVDPKQGVPAGMHINRFVFEDGSTLVLQTIK
mgnify:CR=1 FL=1